MISTRKIVEQAGSDDGRYHDLRIRWLRQRLDGSHDPEGARLLSVGGRWDRLEKRWAGPGETARDLGLHTGQLEAATWLADWFRAKASGQPLLERGAPVYSLLLDGGRRGGKTDLGAKAGITYPLLRPGVWSWLISETEKKTNEFAEVIRGILPSSWYDWLGPPHCTFTLRNGSVIWLRSAHDPDGLKAGRCDFAVINEAQLISERAFAIVRAATADTGGLTVLCANPPEDPIGFWIERFREEVIAGRRPAKEFFLDARLNPHIDHASLLAMKSEVDDRTFRREICGEFLPRADVVFHGWSDGKDGNVAPLPNIGEVTQEFLRRHLHRDLDTVLGVDFQRVPYPCAVEARAYRNPENPDGDPLIWFKDEILVEDGDENGLSEALIAKGYDPRRTALICDASGSWQGIDRKRKTPSFDILKSLGWVHVFRPDQNSEKNPPILERVKNANALFKTAAGKRRVFSAPENLTLNQALKLWETRSGVPYRRSPYAHFGDAASYVLYRLFPRAPTPKSGFGPKDFIPFTPVARGPRML